MNKLASQIIVDILTQAMKMPAGSVWLRDQNRKIPTDNGLYIEVGIVNTAIMSNETYIRDGMPSQDWDQLGKTYDNPDQAETNFDQNAVENYDQPGEDYDQPGENWDAKQNATTEVNKVQAREDLQIDIWSRSNAAIFRNWEIVAALQSIYAQQQMELVQFKIFRIPRSFINTSSAEGGSQLNRYTITISCFVWYVKETLLTTDKGDYYDDFTQRVDDRQTIGSDKPLIAFEINQEGIT
jgi:hypothetical protein